MLTTVWHGLKVDMLPFCLRAHSPLLGFCLFSVRKWAVAVFFLLQIIMAKPAGGPKPPQGKKDFDEDDWIWCCPPDAPLILKAPTWIYKPFSTCLFKAQQFGLFCRGSHALANQIICERKMYGWHCLLFMFSVPNKRHLGCHAMFCVSPFVIRLYSGSLHRCFVSANSSLFFWVFQSFHFSFLVIQSGADGSHNRV